MPQAPARFDDLLGAHMAELTARYAGLLETLDAESIVLATSRNCGSVHPFFRHWIDLPGPLDATLEVHRSGRVRLWIEEAKLTALESWQWNAFEHWPHERVLKRSQTANGIVPLSITARHGAAPSGNLEARLAVLHLKRTPYEATCLRVAANLASRGHRAAGEAFLSGGSPDEVLAAFFHATEQDPLDVPYPPIVAFGRDAATVHPTGISSPKAPRRHNALLDLGVRFRGYVADVTRSYATTELGIEITDRLQRLQQAVIDAARPGRRFVELHALAHRHIAELLRELEVISCSVEAAIISGLTEAFFPHGTGHYIGVDVHASGGMFHDDGRVIAEPATLARVSIRRSLGPSESFTIEPGIYFDPDAVASAVSPAATHAVNWDRLRFVSSAIAGARHEDVLLVEDDAVVRLS